MSYKTRYVVCRICGAKNQFEATIFISGSSDSKKIDGVDYQIGTCNMNPESKIKHNREEIKEAWETGGIFRAGR